MRPIPNQSDIAELSTLVGLFYPQPKVLGEFEEVTAADVREPYRHLLAHEQHMTVAMEQHHGCDVDVHVLEARMSGQLYTRRILLKRQSDGRVVQFGVVRMSFDNVPTEVRRQIESQSIPLGRILIEHNLLREIQLLALWRIKLGNELQRLFGCEPRQITYGRTAIIRLGGIPAVELLEIVAPE